MAWEHLDVNKPHLVYIILGGFTSLFMLCSSVIKERMYIGEATVATLCGLIFGPHAANLIDPGTWGNTDQITLEFSRIVLVVQCFAVGVELPRAYMEKHWKSVVFLLVPVMTFGWLVTSLFIWAVFHHVMNWLDCLVVAACVTATDPVLASSVVGKGKFAKRVPKHLRDILSAESGCNDGMAFPFIYLGLYLVHYRPNAGEVFFHWFCYTILYECVFGAIYGFLVGYIARRAIRVAHENNIIDRESFLVFYFVLALFCAGSGSILGMDDLLIGFACGTGFSNDGWFTDKTEESHVSNVIDLLINLAFFVYLGTIIPWEQYNSAVLGMSAWRLVVLALLVLFFRRIPIMLLLKPLIPDIKTWREALFAGHFGPIGVGAIFVAILARAELETDSTTPLAILPEPGFEHRNIIELIWPITTFLVVTSILIHGSTIAVFTLGKHINTLTITMSYTQANEEGNWMDRLPRIQSRTKSSMSMKKLDDSEESLEQRMPEYPAAALPKNFLRRQKEEDTPRPSSRGSKNSSRRRHHKSSSRAGGPVTQSAIAPLPRVDTSSSPSSPEESTSRSPETSEPTRPSSRDMRRSEPEEEVYQEGGDTVIEDEQGNVLEVMHSQGSESKEKRTASIEREVTKLMDDQNIQHGVAQEQDTHSDHPVKEAMRQVETEAKDMVAAAASGKSYGWKGMREKMAQLNASRKAANEKAPRAQAAQAAQDTEGPHRRAPARAFRFGRTIIVEDEDGEVIKKYDIPGPSREGEEERKMSYVDPERTKQRLQKMGHWLGVGQGQQHEDEAGPSRPPMKRNKSTRFGSVAEQGLGGDDEGIRFTVDGNDRRMSKAEFIQQIQSLDPKSRAEVVEDSNAPEKVKRQARADAAESEIETMIGKRKESVPAATQPQQPSKDEERASVEENRLRPQLSRNLESYASDITEEEIPFHAVSADLSAHSAERPTETAAQRRRRLASESAQQGHDSDSEDDGTERVPPSRGKKPSRSPPSHGEGEEGETAAERRRRAAALGHTQEESDSDEDSGRPRDPPKHAVPGAIGPGSAEEAGRSTMSPSTKIRFADQFQPSRPGRSGTAGTADSSNTSSSGPKIKWKS